MRFHAPSALKGGGLILAILLATALCGCQEDDAVSSLVSSPNVAVVRVSYALFPDIPTASVGSILEDCPDAVLPIEPNKATALFLDRLSDRVLLKLKSNWKTLSFKGIDDMLYNSTYQQLPTYPTPSRYFAKEFRAIDIKASDVDVWRNFMEQNDLKAVFSIDFYWKYHHRIYELTAHLTGISVQGKWIVETHYPLGLQWDALHAKSHIQNPLSIQREHIRNDIFTSQIEGPYLFHSQNRALFERTLMPALDFALSQLSNQEL